MVQFVVQRAGSGAGAGIEPGSGGRPPTMTLALAWLIPALATACLAPGVCAWLVREAGPAEDHDDRETLLVLEGIAASSGHPRLLALCLVAWPLLAWIGMIAAALWWALRR